MLARPPGLAGDLSEAIRAIIADERLSPGARLPTEMQLAGRFGVSRAVVREAIARLKSEGIVETRQGAGAFVSSDPRRRSFRLTHEQGERLDLAEIFELRATVEARAAELAARRHAPADLAAMQGAFAAMRAAFKAGMAGALDDDAFHNAIAAASGNRYLARFIGFLGEQLSETRRLSWAPEALSSGKTAAALDEHAAILAAIEKRDAAGAARAARRHALAAAKRFGIPAEAGEED